jgi:hypothetical protein
MDFLIGLSSPSSTFMLFAYLIGNVIFAQYLQIFYVKGAGELTIFAGPCSVQA